MLLKWKYNHNEVVLYQIAWFFIIYLKLKEFLVCQTLVSKTTIIQKLNNVWKKYCEQLHEIIFSSPRWLG